ncbi:breast carcinoma-amplified sequence 1 isoform X1 [Motacilla alba alba]|uniref:breast carcinoma-amplified sequence 1 isoform X1 n=1 Tax=Motacilla alba alba TaxID=1094192 RepID=UPI0018D4EDCC|nr:breast carcinoma-amplified sequence 1 isoform X1 [Motacilla alba alba]XP_038015252.1 breast carcinoma-amplified sequence 1 isoform X1 [Motacilla alba alba]
MGNNPSVPEEAEDDNTCTVKSYQPLSDSPDSISNGSVVFAQNPPLAVNGEADARAPAGRDNAVVPSGGSAASRALPAARPRSLLPFPWAVPAPAEEPAAAAAPAEATLDATRLNKAPSEGTEAPGAAAARQGGHKNLGQAPLQDVELAGTPEGRDVAAPKGRQVTLFDRIFRLEKGTARTRGGPEEGRQRLDVPNGSIAAGAPHGEPPGKEIDECRQKELGQDSAGEQGPAAAAPARAQAEQDSPQAAAGQGSVMSFLKTLVSPSKAEAKSDSEDKGSKAEKGPGGQPGPKAAAESHSKGAKKKKAESPKLGHSTFSKLFRHKAAKETQQTTNTKSPEQPAVPCVKADRNVPPCQEAPAKQNPKAPEAAAPAQGVSTEPPREGTRDKGSATPLPLSKLFWKKNSSEEAEAVSNEKAEVALEAPVAPDRDESKSPESAEVKPRGAESKTPKANLRKFFKLSVKGDGGTPRSQEGDGPSPRHHTLNATEKPLAPSESDPGGPRSKEGSKDKKSTVELGKQKGREQPEPREQPAAEPDSIHNGGDAKEPSYKKTEKRQSLGGFFKGLGSKRMSDAEVQTDPVSILPAGKSK